MRQIYMCFLDNQPPAATHTRNVLDQKNYQSQIQILKCYENTVIPKSIKNKPNFILNKTLKYYSVEDWVEYLSKYQLNYDSILLDDDLRQMIFKIYHNDFLIQV